MLTYILSWSINGSHLKPLNAFRQHEQRLAIEQRKPFKKVKFSSNWQKQKSKI
jgi:putative transposase